KQIGLALHIYHDTNGTFPAGYLYSTTPPTPVGTGGVRAMLFDRRWRLPPVIPDPQAPGWGWASLILPQLEQGNLAAEIDYRLPVEGINAVTPRITLLKA